MARNAEQPLWQAVFAGSVGGFCATIVGHPFESVKVRLQTGKTKGLFRNVYAGVSSPIMGVTPLWAIAYFGYKWGLSIQPEDTHPTIKGAVAGGISGGVSCILKTPVELVKVVAQKDHIGAGAAVKKIFSEQGLRGMYRGNLATISLMVPSQFVFFCTYETVHHHLKESVPNLAARSFLAGGLSGIVEWTTTMPMDVIKTKCQTTPGAGMLSVWKSTWKTQGMRGLYAGYLPAILRAFPANGAAFAGIEMANRTLQSYRA